jgi:hypothetical protein
MSNMIGSSLYDACQSFLAAHPTLMPLASTYKCVKRMEQVLMYLLEPDSCPHLQGTDKSFHPIHDKKDVGAFERAAGRMQGLHISDNSHQPHLLFKKGDYLRARQMSLLVPFLKIFEYDTGAGTYSGARIPAVPVSEVPGVVMMDPIAAAAENGDTVSKLWQGHNVYDITNEEEKTARMAEMFVKFWSCLPSKYREVGETQYYIRNV